MTEARLGVPDLGVGVGLRVPHYRTILERQPAVDFFEIISENFMVDGGKPLYHLERVAERYPLIQHGVSLNIGGPGEPRPDYMARLKQLNDRVAGAWLSDHFCWTGVPGVDLHDLLPLPATKAVVKRVAERARRIQGELGTRFALENASSYMQYRSSTMPEWELVSEIVERADIGLMFDVNNVYVAAYNHGFDPYEYVNHVPLERVVQIHIAGHDNLGTHLIDTHNGAIIEPVWDLYRYTIERAGAVSTLIEWDSDIPELDVLLALAERVRSVKNAALAVRADRKARGEDPRGPLRHGTLPQVVPPDPERNPHRGWEQGGPRELTDRVVGSAAE